MALVNMRHVFCNISTVGYSDIGVTCSICRGLGLGLIHAGIFVYLSQCLTSSPHHLFTAGCVQLTAYYLQVRGVANT